MSGHGAGETSSGKGTADTHMAIVEFNDEENNLAIQVQAEKDKFWESEEVARTRSALPLPFEAFQLTKHAWQGPQDPVNVKKVLALFGAQRGAGKASRALLRAVAAEQSLQPGDMISQRSVGYSLCKHLLISGWKGCCPGLDALPPTQVCYCLPRTALMPMGCHHNKQSLMSSRTAEDYASTLCLACSECVRCGK